MKLLLTSSGITNKTIAAAFERLLEKPFSESKLVFIPTAADIGTSDRGWLVEDLKNCYALQWKTMDILSLAATPQEKIWRPRVESADAIFFGGGNSFYLMHWLTRSGLAASLPSLLKTRVYAGISAGSIVAGSSLALSNRDKLDVFELYYEDQDLGDGREYGAEKSLELVNFHVRPHLNSGEFPHARAEYIAEVAKGIKEPIYAIDDQSAVVVVDGKVEIVSEGEYLVFNR